MISSNYRSNILSCFLVISHRVSSQVDFPRVSRVLLVLWDPVGKWGFLSPGTHHVFSYRGNDQPVCICPV